MVSTHVAGKCGRILAKKFWFLICPWYCRFPAMWVPQEVLKKQKQKPALNILLPPWCWLWCLGQRICRRGTERPCYKVSYIQDSRRRLTFEDARLACRMDGGELLSIETESEQQLMERFIQQLQAGDGDFWIGLRRSPHRYRAGTTSPGCPSQYYWLDGSKAKFRSFSFFFLLTFYSLCMSISAASWHS